jgi:hypothetical protein
MLANRSPAVKTILIIFAVIGVGAVLAFACMAFISGGMM